jgi:hypothetical protein
MKMNKMTSEKTKEIIHSYIGYSNAVNPDWFIKLCENLTKIKYYEWVSRCQFHGVFWKNKKYVRIINKLKERNKLIIQKQFPENVYSKKSHVFILSFWKDRKGQSVPILEVWKNK